MKCPFCRRDNTEVFNTRTTKFGSQIWRRRRCLDCQKAFTTYESANLGFLRVTGSTRRKTPYSRSQLYASLSTAFLDIPHKPGTVDAITDTVEAKVLDLQQSDVSTTKIAAIVLSTLKHFNTAAFIRYLSTHTEVASSAQLKRELKKY